jgi:hypothetical protein
MMALLGKGALVIWHDPAPEAESDYNEWHSKEHMFERVGVPGFRRGQRAVAISGSPEYFNFYEVDDIATLESKAYLDRLNDPTPWTRRVVPKMHNNSRTLCRVTASFGVGGVPALWTMILLSPGRDRAAELQSWLADDVLPKLVERPGILGAHTEFIDWVILVGGYDGDVLAGLRSDALSDERLTKHGAASSRVRGLYRLVHCVTEPDLPA